MSQSQGLGVVGEPGPPPRKGMGWTRGLCRCAGTPRGDTFHGPDQRDTAQTASLTGQFVAHHIKAFDLFMQTLVEHALLEQLCEHFRAGYEAVIILPALARPCRLSLQLHHQLLRHVASKEATAGAQQCGLELMRWNVTESVLPSKGDVVHRIFMANGEAARMEPVIPEYIVCKIIGKAIKICTDSSLKIFLDPVLVIEEEQPNVNKSIFTSLDQVGTGGKRMTVYDNKRMVVESIARLGAFALHLVILNVDGQAIKELHEERKVL
eukprot:CAMPEP_0177638058 /NCGR_PEP_ID=MMETSP0447-20121125/5290_1 /TAXON_ID=0 /ORGANISM="Stygamoeba regulata, Strain BSH-02190019" /LENGTH=265 /DNA_ID=CAMNT_0019140003 /DNA_START=658 /DNA_END=1456 /DNA_ORIENTATION=+